MLDGAVVHSAIPTGRLPAVYGAQWRGAASVGLVALGLRKPAMTAAELLALRTVLADRRGALLDRLAVALLDRLAITAEDGTCLPGRLSSPASCACSPIFTPPSRPSMPRSLNP